jgi:signal transduction histidine kinase
VKLSVFITEHLDEILLEWVAFARTLGPATHDMSVLALQDHAKPILEEIALDIETHQSAEQQEEKSLGQAPEDLRSAAAVHGTQRHINDFSLVQLAAEFRALRATVLRLWLPNVTQMSGAVVQEMVRFNEAIDQALAESVVTYSARGDQSRELFLAVLGHDLRAPLSTMSMAGTLLLRPGLPADQVPVLAARVQRSAKLMTSMVADLLGFTRTQLGSKMPTLRGLTDVKTICEEAAEDAAATHPATTFEVRASGDLGGSFDPVRLHQLFANLLVNAAQYGKKGLPVVISASKQEHELVVSVTNHGPPIPENAWRSIFKPLIQLPSGDDDDRPRTSLGLGLFVAREIAMAHGGSIDVRSDEVDGTTFTVRLPLHPADTA